MDNPVTNVTPASPAADAPAQADSAPKVEAPKAETPAVAVDENGVATNPAKKVWKLKVNGKEVDYDASDEARLQRDVQKVLGIEEKAKTAAQKSQESEELISLLQSDPKGFAKRCKVAGIDAQKLATEILYEQIRLNSLSPEQRELEEYKEREREAEEKRKTDEEAAKVADVNRKTQEWAAKFEKDCQAVLAANQLPKTRLSLALIAQYIDAGLANKQELSVEQVLPYVARDLKEIHASTMEKLDGEELLNYVGETLANKIAKARVARYNKAQQVTPAPKAAPSVQKTPSGKDLSKLKGKAYWAELRRMKSEQGIDMYPGRQS